MDFDTSKENIQPLRGGRNVSQLGVALQAQTDMETQRDLMQQRADFEQLIRTYTGSDPLENWYNYISWIEQSYPKQGHEGNLLPLLEKCIKLFEDAADYVNDRRMCKLFIKYIDLQQNPLELFNILYRQGSCKKCSDFYKAWAYYYEAAGDFQHADRVFQWGKRENAEPYDDLDNAHNNLIFAAGQHIIYGSNDRELAERRHALTSLFTYRPGAVSSVRVVNHSTPGVFGSVTNSRPNAGIQIYEDQGSDIQGAGAGSVSVVAAGRQEVRKENTLKPGTWTTVPVKKRHTVQRVTPGFTVHEDCDEIRENINSATFVSSTQENFSNWIVSLTIPEPKDDRMIPMYPKSFVYAELGKEFSIEELRAARYLNKSNTPNIVEVVPIEADQVVESIVNVTPGKMEQNFISHSIITPEQIPSALQRMDKHLQNTKHLVNKSKTPSPNMPNFEVWSSDPMKRKDMSSRDKISPKLTSSNRFKSKKILMGEIERDTSSNSKSLDFNLWNSLTQSPDVVCKSAKKAASKFAIYEQSNLAIQEETGPKGSAMKTPFKDLNAEDLAETGSRGGMDVAAAAPVDSAKRLTVFDDDIILSYDKYNEPEHFSDLTCNTQTFNFNLNVMKVSTPQKQDSTLGCSKEARKQLFIDADKTDKVLSTIFEETKSSGLCSSSSNANTKSLSSCTKQTTMPTISEEHNSYLMQNLMANAALRSSLGELMNYSSPAGNRNPSINRMSSSPRIPSPVPVTPLPIDVKPMDTIPTNPFKLSVIDKFLQHVNFPGPHLHGYYCVNSIPQLVVRKGTVSIGPDKYVIDKQLGKGTYGTVFRGVNLKYGSTVAIKLQRPANRWEFYICRELQSRLAQHVLRERFMHVQAGYFSDQASILTSEFMPCGSLLDVANTVKQKSGKALKENVCIHFCIEMLKVVQAMHEVKIIHADLKPDNFLVQIHPTESVRLQLIDFGCSIDMKLFEPDAHFTYKVTTENFVCCEMLDGRPWNYHTDMFCIAATAHVLLFEKYIDLRCQDGHWSITSRFPRYARVDMWNMFFNLLLNQHDGPANSAAVQTMLQDSLNQKFDEYHNELRYLTNLLKNR